MFIYWFGPPPKGVSLLLVRIGTVAGILGWACLTVVAVAVLIGAVAAAL